jgi:hypothetical protein
MEFAGAQLSSSGELERLAELIKGQNAADPSIAHAWTAR